MIKSFLISLGVALVVFVVLVSISSFSSGQEDELQASLFNMDAGEPEVSTLEDANFLEPSLILLEDGTVVESFVSKK